MTILDFIKEHHQHVEGLGSVCAFSLFDLDRFGSPRYGSKVAPPPTHPTPPSDHARGPLLRAPRPLRWYRDNQDGKVEKSLLNFKVRPCHLLHRSLDTIVWRPDLCLCVCGDR